MTTFTTDGKASLDARIKEAVEDINIPGFNIGISNVDGEFYFNGGGPHSVNDPQSGNVNPDSIFWICSQTKLITALAALKLIEQGKISYDTVVADYLPQLRNPVIVDESGKSYKPAQNQITVKHLLNFSSGLFYPPSTEPSLDLGYTDKEMHVAEGPLSRWFSIVQRGFPGIPIRFEPGTNFVYGWSSDILGFFVEKVSGVTLEVFFKKNIFDPLGMESSFYLTPELRKRLVHLPYYNAASDSLKPFTNQLEVIEQDPTKLSLHLGGVGLYSSMRDYLKLLRHLMRINAGLSVPNPILSQETVKQIFVPALTEEGSKSISEQLIMVPGTQWGAAMGFVTQDWPGGRRRKGTAFWGGWAGTQHFIDPTNGIALVFGIQICPYGVPGTTKLWYDLETLVYAALDTGK